MKRFYHLLALLFLFVGTAAADSFAPTSGTKYLLQCKGNSSYATYNSSSTLSSSQATALGATEGINVLSATSSPTSNSCFVIEAGTGDYANYFTIRLASDNTMYVYSIVSGGKDANSDVGVKTISSEETAGSECYWTISTQGDYYNIIPYGSNTNLSWNKRGSNNSISQIGMWSTLTYDDNMWSIISTSDYMSAFTSIPDIATGYYTISCGEQARAYSIYNDFLNTYNQSYNLTFANTSQVGTTNNYIWKVETITDTDNLKKTLSIKNGQGTGLGVAAWTADWGTTVYNQLTYGVYSTDNEAYYFTEGVNGGGSTYVLSDGSRYLTSWAYSTDISSYWKFTSVTDNFYTVSIVDAEGNVFSDGYAICNGEYAKNGGFITAPTNTTDVTAYAITNYTTNVDVNTTNKTVTITYTPDYAAMYSELLTTATTLLNDAGNLGYPTTTCEAYTALKAFGENASATSDDVTSLTAAISAYKTTTDVVLPEDGGVYKISVVYPDGTSQTLYWDSTLETPRIAGLATPTDTRSSYFFCHKTSEGKFVFVNKDGKYLSFFDSGSDTDSSKKGGCANGASNVYGTNVLWTLERASATQTGAQGSIASGTTDETLYGRLQMKNESEYFLSPRYEADASTACAFISSNKLDKWYDYNGGSDGKMRSFTFKFEEVSTDDIALLSAIPSGQTYATFSTPFPVTLPASLGLTAYTATESGYTYNAGDGSTAGSIQMTKLGTDGADVVIPENTGILLYNESGSAIDAQNLVPAEDATEAEIAESGLVATGADDDTADRSLSTSYSYYVLGSGSNGIGFYPLGTPQFYAFKAFLALSTDASSIKLVFDDSTTSIDAATLESESNAPVYDLTGRRVVKATRGLYIQNGKKFIAR